MTVRQATMFVCLVVLFATCKENLVPFSVAHVDRTTRSSKYPIAVNPSRVGTYAGQQKSGAGYFYDEVLEYRVWLHPEQGAQPLAGDKDYFAAFATYESALRFATENKGAEPPLVLVEQRESINEPTPAHFVWDKSPRTTEWKPEWLEGSHRDANSIPEFLATHASEKK